jgi:hypothetical protein
MAMRRMLPVFLEFLKLPAGSQYYHTGADCTNQHQARCVAGRPVAPAAAISWRTSTPRIHHAAWPAVLRRRPARLPRKTVASRPMMKI